MTDNLKPIDTADLVERQIHSLLSAAIEGTYYITQRNGEEPGHNAEPAIKRLARDGLTCGAWRMQDAREVATRIFVDRLERLEAELKRDRLFVLYPALASDEILRKRLADLYNAGGIYTCPKVQDAIYSAAQRHPGLFKLERTSAEVNEARIDAGQVAHPYTVRLTDDGFAFISASERLRRDELKVGDMLRHVREESKP